MTETETIDQLKKEIEQLTKDIYQYKYQLDQLSARVANLGSSHETGIGKPSRQQKAGSQSLLQNWNAENFIGLKLLHLVGIIVLVIGLSIGVKYAIDSNLISEKARILLAYSAGLLLFFFSVRLREKYAGFSSILFSGAMASLYFTTYAAFSYYAIFPFSIAFVLMILLTVFTVFKAMSYNRQEIAILGLVGAYGIPFLISKNADRADLFFLYITIINCAVVFLSVRKQWKLVGRIAGAITWVLFIGWATMRFNPALQWIGFLFMFLFFFLFHLAVIIPKIIYKEKLAIDDSYQLTLNNVALYISTLLVFGSTYTDVTIATITVIIALFIFLQALAVYKVWQGEKEILRLLTALSLILFLMFIAYRWEGLTVTLLWLLTAVIIFGWGAVKKLGIVRMTAMLLMGLTLVKLVLLDSMTFGAVQKIIAFVVLGILLLVVSFFYQKFKHQLFYDDK